MATPTLVANVALPSQSSLVIESLAVSGGTLYIATLYRQTGTPEPVALTFVPVGASSPQRFLALTSAKSDAGVPLTAAAGTPTGAVGVSRVAGTNLQLVGEATSGNAKTDKAIFELNLPDSYIPGADVPVTVNAAVTGSGTLTGASTTLTVAAYTETNGVEAALTVSAAQQIVAAGSDLTFTITGTNLVAGQHLVIELILLVTSASGANTGAINNVSIKA